MRDSRRVHWLGQSWSAVTGQAGRQHSGGQMMSKQSATGGTESLGNTGAQADFGGRV